MHAMENHSRTLSSYELAICKKIYESNLHIQSTETCIIPEVSKCNAITLLSKHKEQLALDKENLPITQMQLGIAYGSKIRNGRLLAFIGFGLLGNELLNPSPYMVYSCSAALLCIGAAKYQFKQSIDLWNQHRSLPHYIQSTQALNNKLLDILSKAHCPD